MTDKPEALKSCPFCGSELVRAVLGIVGCRNCGAQVRTADVNAISVAIDQWNTRAHDAEETAALTKLREEMAVSWSMGAHTGATEWREGLARGVAELDAILKRRGA